MGFLNPLFAVGDVVKVTNMKKYQKKTYSKNDDLEDDLDPTVVIRPLCTNNSIDYKYCSTLCKIYIINCEWKIRNPVIIH